MIHITLTGPSAGQPLCGVNKQSAAGEGHEFSHVPYGNADRWLAQPELCPTCKATWIDAMSDDE